MRLLNAHTLVIHNFFGDIPPYAILSHTWEDEEVSYQDFQDGKITALKGYTKILGCCEQVIADSLEYVWIDTCCIDKSSSSELQEAINSMFNFYRDAAVCYAYLQDVHSGTDTLSLNSSFSKSRWFTRGWTLQELLAPSLLEFYAADWTPLGTRDDLKKTVALITRIDQEFFTYGKFSDYSIAQKFSWASGRQTTRVEDEAYCLLGLFGVSMPLLYGEGRRAFMRLQEELMRASDDQSIFAWSTVGKSGKDHRTESGLFAPSPAAFTGSGDIIRGKQDFSSPPYSITNKGISIYLPLIEPDSGYAIPYGGSTGGPAVVSIALTPTGSLAILNCQSKKNGLSQLAIVIEQTDGNTRYTRTNPSLGLLSIPLADITGKARQKSLLIQAHNIDNEGVGWTSQKRGQLVVLLGFQPSESVTLKDHTRGLKCHSFTNGVVSFRMPIPGSGTEYDGDGDKVRLEFEHAHGQTFTIVVTSTGTAPRTSMTAEVMTSWRRFMLTASESEHTAKDLPPARTLPTKSSEHNKADAEGSNDIAMPLPVEELHHAVRISLPKWDVFAVEIKKCLNVMKSTKAKTESTAHSLLRVIPVSTMTTEAGR